MDLSARATGDHTMDEGAWTPMQSEGGHPFLMSGDGVRDWFNGELDRLEKRRERGIFSSAQVNQPPPKPRNPETSEPQNPETPKHRRALAHPDSPHHARDPRLAIGPRSGVGARTDVVLVTAVPQRDPSTRIHKGGN